MKYIKILLVSGVILVAVSVLMGDSGNVPIMLFILAILNIVNAWESYRKKKIESILLFLMAFFTGIVSIFIMFF